MVIDRHYHKFKDGLRAVMSRLFRPIRIVHLSVVVGFSQNKN